MPQTNSGEQSALDDLRKAATLSLEELAKLMADHGLFGSHFPLDNSNKALEKLEKQARLSSECEFKTG